MPLDEHTRRLAFLLQRDLLRLVERERAREERGEEIAFDTVSRMATWETRRGDVIGRWYGEIIATYVHKDRILRWSWAGRPAIATATHAEIVSREGQARGVDQLARSVIGDLDEDDACTLARLGVLVARGEGMQVQRKGAEIDFIGLFDSPRPRDGDASESSRYSVPPPAVSSRGSSPPGDRASAARVPVSSSHTVARSTSPPPAPYRSLPPIREVYEPRSSRSSIPPASRQIREPARAIFIPVATCVLKSLTKVAAGFQQALFVLTVDSDLARGPAEKRRLVVLLVAVDEIGQLRAIDPPSELIETAARMIEADQEDGNGRWRKLSARITPKADGGATLNVDVL